MSSTLPVIVFNGDQVARAMSFLSRVEKLEIRQRIERHGCKSYVLEVFLVQTQRQRELALIAKNPFQRAEPPRESDYEVDHAYAAFVELAQLVRLLVGSRQHSDSIHHDDCRYCSRLREFIRCTPWRPSPAHRLTTPKTAKMRWLTTFMNQMLHIVAAESTASPDCQASVHVPLLLERFLRRRVEDSLGII